MKLSPRRAETLSLIALVLQIAFFLLSLLVAHKSNSTAVRVEGWHFLGGILVWFVLLLQFRQRRLAGEEKADAEEFVRLRSEGKDTSVFESAAADSTLRLAQRRSEWLEKYLVPGFSVLTAFYLVGAAIWNYQRIKLYGDVVLANRETVLGASAYLAGFALISFLFGRYAVGMSRQEEWRPLRAGGSYLVGNALACLALAIVLVVANAGTPMAERVTAYVLIGAMVAIGVEMFLNMVFDIYRPRMKGQYHRAAMESRILGLFSEPGGMLSTATHAIDYQFGFKVSETWFYKLLERTAVLLVLVQVLVLWLMSGIAIVDTGHEGVVERWGRPLNVASPLTSGLHWKLPWPMDKVHQFPTEVVQTLDIGFVSHEDEGRKLDHKPVLWTQAHYKSEFPYMVAVAESSETVGGRAAEKDQNSSIAVRNDFDLLAVGLTVHYRISDVAQYGYGQERCYRNPDELLEAICYRQTMQFAARSDIDTLLGPGRHDTTEILHQAIQEEVANYQLGVDIVFVGLASVHPPIEVAPSYETVVAALQERQAIVLEAKGIAKTVLSMAGGEAVVLQAAAEAAAFEREVLTQADSYRFAQQVQAYALGQDIYLWREYLSVLDEFLPGMRKYVFASDHVNRWVYQMDLTESQQPDLFEGLGLPESNQEN